MINLLTDPLIRATLAGGDRTRFTLPGLLARLARDEIESFPALRPHQRAPFHCFLAQLGAIALHRAGKQESPRDEQGWARLLRALTADHPDDSSWSLVVDDPTKPAFLQPPAPGGIDGFKNRLITPDQLDMLVTSRNHDLKRAVADRAEIDDWLFALIALQTSEGFLGAGNFGVARMNGGFSSRLFLGLAPPGGIGAHIGRDITVLLEARPALLANEGLPRYQPENGHALLWRLPWDGTEQLQLTDLDPYFIEICRRVRLEGSADRLTARTTGSAVSRIAAKEIMGLTGDPWAPVDRTEHKAVTLSGAGFSYDRLSTLLFDPEKTALPIAAKRQPSDPAAENYRLIARGLVRGQGKTEGYHERVLPVTPRVRLAFGSRTKRQELGALSGALIQEIGLMAGILREAIAIMASGGKDRKKLSRSDREHGDWARKRLTMEADRQFFASLFEQYDAWEGLGEIAARNRKNAYLRSLRTTAEHLLGVESGRKAPVAMRHRAIARAESYLNSALRKNFPELFDLQPKEMTDA